MTTVCVGDRYRIGDAIFEVTQPRVTCYKVGLRLEEPRMPSLLYSHGRPGFYMRVLEEGEVGAGDEIERIAVGPRGDERARGQRPALPAGPHAAGLRRALAIPALSEGWRGSFAALLEQHAQGAAGNQGLARPSTPPAWPGLRRFRVAAARRESASVRSFVLEPVDGEPLPGFPPGQFLALKLRAPGCAGGAAALVLAGRAAATGAYRIAVKREADGRRQRLPPRRACRRRRASRSARRAATSPSTSMRRRPVVLLSAGVGVTPCSPCSARWPGPAARARCGGSTARAAAPSTPFAAEARELLSALPGCALARALQPPRADDRRAATTTRPAGSTSTSLLELGVPRDADFYLCGPSALPARLDRRACSAGASRPSGCTARCSAPSRATTLPTRTRRRARPARAPRSRSAARH